MDVLHVSFNAEEGNKRECWINIVGMPHLRCSTENAKTIVEERVIA